MQRTYRVTWPDLSYVLCAIWIRNEHLSVIKKDTYLTSGLYMEERTVRSHWYMYHTEVPDGERRVL